MKAVLARFGCIASLASCFRRRFGLLRWSSASDKSCGNCGSGPARTSTEVIFPCSGIVVDMWDIEVRSVCGGRPSSVCEMRCCGAGSIRTSAACTVGGCPNGSRGCIITRPTYLPTFEDMIHGIHHWPGSAPSRGSTLPPLRAPPAGFAAVQGIHVPARAKAARAQGPYPTSSQVLPCPCQQGLVAQGLTRVIQPLPHCTTGLTVSLAIYQRNADTLA